MNKADTRMSSRVHRDSARPPRRAVLAGLMLALAALLCTAATPAHAQDARQAQCTFLEIKASSGEGGIDGALSALAGKLKRPPFSSWKSFSLEAKHSQKLALMKAVDVSLKMGGKLGALFRQHNQAPGKKGRLSLSLTLDDKNGKRALDTKVHVDEGDYFVIVVGQSGGEGQLVAFSCNVK
ncbi:hypothetical protein Hoch_4929 [Haliangium ochraceum DSM 14365]|uniref:Uncharacterized protein n=2 Tax=Haliangium ochraceum TaxID=80816 RepID=D0LU54_HALO1|nr:hypothetical protein Hoch_4929 [Haliangium ochraceum DSM 14365]